MTDLDLANDILADVKNNKTEDATRKIKSLIDKKADLKDKWGAISRLAITIGEIDLSLTSASNYLKCAPNELLRLIQVAGIFAEAGKLEDAINIVKPLIPQTNSLQLYHFLGTVYSQLGDNEQAKSYLNKAIEMSPKTGITWLTLASIHQFTADDPKFQELQSIESNFTDNHAQHGIPYWFALGKALIDTKSYTSAFSKLAIGANLIKKQNGYNASKDSAFVESIISHQTDEYLKEIAENKQQSGVSPIFIIGLPRSGTTLLQQILTSHSQIDAGGEFRGFGLATLGYSLENLHNISKLEVVEQNQCLTDIYDKYCHYSNQRFGEDTLIVDKTLNLNRNLGLISKVFPKSAMIKINRDPSDTAWSCYRTLFNQGSGWSYDLENIAHFFNLENKLFNHWNKLFGDRILEIDYEDLVSKPEETISKCLKHCGLNFEENTLNFYQSKHPVLTASVGQVRKPFNTDSIGSSKNLSELLKPFTSNYM